VSTEQQRLYPPHRVPGARPGRGDLHHRADPTRDEHSRIRFPAHWHEPPQPRRLIPVRILDSDSIPGDGRPPDNAPRNGGIMAGGTTVWVWIGLMWSSRVRLVLDQYGGQIT